MFIPRSWQPGSQHLRSRLTLGRPADRPTGRTGLHRRVGPYALSIGPIAWAAMIFVGMRALVAHPIPREARKYDWLLPGPRVYPTFGILLAWAFHERRRPAEEAAAT